MEQLKKCPFCGGEAKWANALHNYIECKECDFETIWYDTEEEAIAIWNTRKPMERIVERLKQEVISLEDNYGDYVECIPEDIVIEIVKEEMQ